MIDPIHDPLADRLKAMNLATPPALVPKVLSATRNDRRFWAPALPDVRVWAAAVALFFVLVGAGSYFAPRFGQALASAPVIGGPAGRLLEGLGLIRVVGRVTTFDAVATSSGYRVHLVGGYADSLQTVLILHIDDPAGINPSVLNEVKLTDQFGRTYERQGPEWSQAQQGSVEQAIVFDPMQWPASAVGARLTLEIKGLRVSPPAQRLVAGNWVLRGTLATDDAKALAVPSAGQLDGTTIRFHNVRTTPAALEVRMEIDGRLAAQLNTAGHIAGSLTPQPGLTVELVDPSGEAQMAIGGRTEITANQARLDWFWVAPTSGKYQLVVTAAGVGSFTRDIVVP